MKTGNSACARRPVQAIISIQRDGAPEMSDAFARKLAMMLPSVKSLKKQRDDALERITALEERVKDIEDAAVLQSVSIIRSEAKTMPNFAYHLPLDFEIQTLPPKFDPSIWIEGEPLPLPPPSDRHGHAGDEQQYLDWGRYDRDLMVGYMKQAGLPDKNLSIMDFGCSSGRVMRHFYPEMQNSGWKVTGVDVSSRMIEWLRRNFPKEFQVYAGPALPMMPFEDNSFDVIYGMSVFTHIKYLWDAWLLELRRILKPGGVLLQSVHTETAWRYFTTQRDELWLREALGTLVIEHGEMPNDFVYYGDVDKSQVFWKSDIAVEFWGRYFKDVKIFPPPPKYGYQDWIMATK
jgi:SAM-dependent methyltransferase